MSANGLLDAFLAHARRTPHACAIRAQGEELTYAELVRLVAGFCRALAKANTRAGAIVAFPAERTPRSLGLMLAIVARGAAYLPLDVTQPDARLTAMLADARPSMLVCDGSLRSRLQWTGAWMDAADVGPEDRLDVKPSDDVCYVLFTSGSTGRPKGVAMRSASVAALLDWHVRHPRLGRAARTLQFAPLTFDVSFQEIFSTLAAGGQLILPSEAQRRDPWALLDLLAREQVGRLFLPFVALNALAEAALDQPELVPSTLADVITAGEQLRITPAMRAFFATLPGCVLHNHYGPTETHVVTAYELHGDPGFWPELPPIGRPLPHVDVHVDARSGELLLGGRCLASGYIGRPDLTAERFVERNGTRWYRSGDRVRRNAAGQLEYLGRLDDQIKIAGQRIEPGEIEAALCRHAQVAQAVVVAENGSRLVAHIVPRDPVMHETMLQKQLARHCAALLPDALRPRTFVLHVALPVTTSGKIDRHTLARGSADAPIIWNDTLPLRDRLCELWRQLLGMDALDPDANLFDTGARSLTVVHALTELRRRGHALSIAQVYEHPTPAAQAALLESARNAGVGDESTRGARQRTAFARFARSGAAG